MKKYIGMVAALAAGFLFGLTSIFTKISYSSGLNPPMMTFLRAVLALPVLFLVLKTRHISLKLTGHEWRAVLLVGFLGFAPTGLLLYGAFHFAPVGLATVLHFLFPVIVSLAGALFFKDRMTLPKTIALILGTAGVILFFDSAAGAGVLGLVLALISAFTYTFYMLGVQHTALRSLPQFKISFYFSLCSAVLSGFSAVISGNFTLSFAPIGWVYAAAIALLVSVGAFTLLQVGIRLSGASTAAILSTMEPITGVALGVLVLGESLSPSKIAGCALIIASVIIIAAGERVSKLPAGDEKVV